jgi:hypothetical protein
MDPPAGKGPKKLAAQLRQQVRRRQGGFAEIVEVEAFVFAVGIAGRIFQSEQ